MSHPMVNVSKEITAVMSKREVDFLTHIGLFKLLAVGLARAGRAKQCCMSCRKRRVDLAARLDTGLYYVERLTIPFLSLGKGYEVDLARIMVETKPDKQITPEEACLIIEELVRVMNRTVGNRKILD